MAHMPVMQDFQIEIKLVSVTEFRRRAASVWRYLEVPGHVVHLTRSSKAICEMMLIETDARLYGDYATASADLANENCALQE